MVQHPQAWMCGYVITQRDPPRCLCGHGRDAVRELHIALCWPLCHSCKLGGQRIHPRERHLFIFSQDRKGGAIIGLVGEAVGKPDSRKLAWYGLRTLEL